MNQDESKPRSVVGIPGCGPNRVLIGERIRDLRQARGWIGKELARATGIPHGSICSIENGHMLPDVDRLLALSAVFGVSVDFILKGEGTAAEHTSGDGPADGRQDE